MSVLVLCGPSGCGKSTLVGLLNRDFPGKFCLSVSHTSRTPRPGETDGVHYHFREKSVLLHMRDNHEFLESAEVHGNLYGTSYKAVDAIKEAGKLCVLDIDVQGVDTVIKSKKLDCVYVFLKPPSLEILEKRLRGRGTETEEKIKLRINNAVKEMDFAKTHSDYWHAVLVNDDLDSCYEELKKLVVSKMILT
jgi:guanylate kinase